MTPPPVAVGLTICDYVIVEAKPNKITLVGGMTRLGLKHFPSVAPPFHVFATFTDGLGDATLKLVITRLDTDEDVYTRQTRIRFQDKFSTVQVSFRVRDCQFPEPGWYFFTLLVDGEWVAQRRFLLSQEGS
jgi:hypothetical protein